MGFNSAFKGLTRLNRGSPFSSALDDCLDRGEGVLIKWSFYFMFCHLKSRRRILGFWSVQAS